MSNNVNVFVKIVIIVINVNLQQKVILFHLMLFLVIILDKIFHFSQRSSAEKVTITIILLIFIWRLINGTLSIITFQTEESREVGCSYYLLPSSIISMDMVIVLTIKFIQLIFLQTQIITNRSILRFNCISTDVILKTFLASSEWLIACV